MSPVQANNERAVGGPDDLCLRHGRWIGDLAALLEDRPGLVAAVS
jgi:hypothetical protein